VRTEPKVTRVIKEFLVFRASKVFKDLLVQMEPKVTRVIKVLSV
jgi:hypothetical protein